MYDIHSHILPAIDDGPPQMEYSVAMALASKNDTKCPSFVYQDELTNLTHDIYFMETIFVNQL